MLLMPVYGSTTAYKFHGSHSKICDVAVLLRFFFGLFNTCGMSLFTCERCIQARQSYAIQTTEFDGKKKYTSIYVQSSLSSSSMVNFFFSSLNIVVTIYINNAMCLMGMWHTLDNYYVFMLNMHLYSIRFIGFISVCLTTASI